MIESNGIGFVVQVGQVLVFNFLGDKAKYTRETLVTVGQISSRKVVNEKCPKWFS